MIKILVTGSTGLLGSALRKELDCLGEANTFYKNQQTRVFHFPKGWDLSILTQVETIFSNFQPDIVVHLASKVAGLYGNQNSNFEMLSDNLKINMNIVDSCKKFKVKKLINMLSTCVFPDNSVYPLTSDQILNGDSHPSNRGYSYSKRILYIASQFLTDVVVVNIIPTNLFGENDNFHLENSHVIPGLIHRCYLAKKNNTDFVIRGSGEALRQFVYANDLAKVIIKSLELIKSETFIVAPPVSSEITISTLVKKIANAMEFTGPIIFNTTFSNGQISKTASVDELLAIFPNFTFTLLDTALSNTVQYFINNYNSKLPILRGI